MGSPHLLHVIAKINGRYRSLAVLYRHYDNRGEFAVQKCRRIIEIFQEPRNRPLLLHELQLATSLSPEKWEASQEDDNERPAFPFVATCLLLGASVTPETGQGYNATHLPFNTPLGAADEGCTILDITGPAAVRYAFVFVLPQQYAPEIWKDFGNTPLTAWEYAAFYGELSDEEGRLSEMLKGQEVVDSTVIASPLIDEDALESAWPHLEDQKSWRRRADLGLPVIVSRPSPANDPALPRLQPAAHHVETLYQAFDQSYKPFQPGYNESLDTEVLAPVSPVKQVANILYLGSLDDKSWKARAAEYEPESRRKLSENAVQYFTFQVDDSPVTPGQTLDVMQSWMAAATAQEVLRRGRKAYTYYFHSTYGQSAQNMVKFFSMAGPNHRVVKPLPGRAFHHAKDAFHCCLDTTVALEEIRPGEWTALLVQQWRRVRPDDIRRMAMTPLGFRCAFVTRGADGGEITVADAETFRSAGRSTPTDEALRELDPGEETYGKGLVDLLRREGGAVNGVPVSLMDRAEVLELLGVMDVVKARQELVDARTADSTQKTTKNNILSNNTVCFSTSSLTSQLPSKKHPNGVRLLALDGGGVRGIASLVILKEIMERVRLRLHPGSKEPCLPADFFEPAAGTSTGGIIGIMLFRLRMSADEACRQYFKIAEQVFSPKIWGWNISWLPGASYVNNGKLLFQSTRFDAEPLRRAVDSVVREFGLDENDKKMKRDAPLFHKDAGGMFVCTTAQNRGETLLVKSHRPGDAPATKSIGNDAMRAGGKDITIGMAALATSAAPTYFPQVEWEVPGQKQPLTFWDGGLLNNSPIDQLWYNRFELVGPDEDEPDVSCLISLGTGYVRPSSGGSSTGVADFIPGAHLLETAGAVMSFATNANAKGEDFSRHYSTLLSTRQKYAKMKYLRFNPNLRSQEIGLEDYTMMKKLEKMTKAYLREKDNQSYIEKAVDAICP